MRHLRLEVSRYLTDWSEGFTFVGDKTIYIAAYSDTFQSALRGNRSAIIKLASIIAHEMAHIDGGDERIAYSAQLAVLRRLDAPRALIDGVQRAMTIVRR